MASLLCEICGARPARGRHSVEGAIMNVCETCGRFGSPVKDVFLKRPGKTRPASVDSGEPEIVPDYADKIRKGREKAGITQKELAARALERESVVAKIEQGEFIPSMPAAKKIEKVLGISLISGPSEPGKHSSGESGRKERFSGPSGMTFGDFIKIKPAKK